MYRKLFKLYLLFVAVGFSSLLAQAETVSAKSCSDSDVQHILRPYFPDNLNSSKFKLSFRYKPADPGQPTLIYFPGGPGSTSIKDTILPFGLPSGTGLIETDPRGIGCNQIPGEILPDNFFSTTYIAKDGLAIINELKIEKYIIYGISYGTMVATVAAGLAEKGQAPRPQAVILEGVLGRAFRPSEVYQGYIDQWNLVREQLTSEIRDLLNQDEPLGISASDWGKGLSSALTIGLFPGKSDYILDLLSGLSANASEAARQHLILGITSQEKQPANSSIGQLFKSITCREITSEVFSYEYNGDFNLDHGLLKGVTGHLCDGISMDAPFDTRQWKTSAPIYYFEGDRDPSTPMFQAKYNFKSQTKSDRTFVTVEGGGHPAFILNLIDCKTNIWSSIIAGGQGLDAALKTCKLSTQVLKSAHEE